MQQPQIIHYAKAVIVDSQLNKHKERNTVEPSLTVTSVQRPPPINSQLSLILAALQSNVNRQTSLHRSPPINGQTATFVIPNFTFTSNSGHE